MRRTVRIVGIVAAGLLGLVILALAGVYLASSVRLIKTYQIDVAPIAIPSDAASIERGRHLATSTSGCAGCHSSDGSARNVNGGVFGDVPPFKLVASNLTSGAGGVGGIYSDEDWVRAIRHGVRPDGTPLLFMPSQNFYNLSDADLGAIIAYIKSAPPVDNQLPASELRMLGRLLLVIGEYQLPVEAIDHTAPRPAAPAPSRSPEYGRYLVTTSVCSDCHGGNLSGGPFDDTIAPNLTPAGALQSWTEQDFIRTMRSGVRPGGNKLSDKMPWQFLSPLTDDELGAIFSYLRSLPPLPYNTPVK